MTNKEFLSSGSLLASEVGYTTDEDGNIEIYQLGNEITLTPRQCLDLKSLLEAHLDVLDFVRSKK